MTATDRTLKLKIIFLHLPVRWDNQSETWFETFCILIRSQTSVWISIDCCSSSWRMRAVPRCQHTLVAEHGLVFVYFHHCLPVKATKNSLAG